MKKFTLQIKGMHCGSCAKTIEKVLLKQKGVISANVNFSFWEALVEYNPEKIDREEIKELIKRAGYETLEKESEMEEEIKKGWQRFWL